MADTEIQDSSENRVKVGVNSLRKICVMFFLTKTLKAPLWKETQHSSWPYRSHRGPIQGLFPKALLIPQGKTSCNTTIFYLFVFIFSLYDYYIKGDYLLDLHLCTSTIYLELRARNTLNIKQKQIKYSSLSTIQIRGNSFMCSCLIIVFN